MMTDERRQWLRGTYLDRIIESAMHFAATRTYFIDADFTAYVADEFDYLGDLTDEDRQYLRDQVGIESLRRVALARAQDREDFFGQLIEAHPDIVVHYADFAFDIGWLDLVRDAVARMRTYPKSWRVRLDGGKEKFGCLVLFVSFDVEARGAMHEIRRMREEFRLRSLATCDICGEAGRLRMGQWAKTTCDKHAAVLGEFREDDGKWADPWRWQDELARGVDKSERLRQQLDAQDYPPESAEVLKDLLPVRKRAAHHVTDPLRSTPLGIRIDDDTWSREGREQELLVEFGWHIQDAVNGAAVKIEYLDGYVRDEVVGWREYAVQPLTESDEEFLRGYLHGLILAEYERIRIKQEAERENE
ncbi:hypothetical protein ACCT18_01145 [Rhizobium ruizarguesonis]